MWSIIDAQGQKDLEKFEDFKRSESGVIYKFDNMIRKLTLNINSGMFEPVDFETKEMEKKISAVDEKISGITFKLDFYLSNDELRSLSFLLLRELKNLSKPLFDKVIFSYPEGKVVFNFL